VAEHLTREEVLGGLPARRARTLLFMIEQQAGRFAADREVGTMALLGERAAENRELDWVEAFALGREPPARPSIRQIEASAGLWSSLVPESPRVRAAVAILLGERHPLVRGRVPGIRAALGLDSEPVARAFADQAGRPIASLWQRPGPIERARWVAAAPGRWLERASAFWAATALTFLLSMGQTVVIIPLAVATVGPVAGAASIAVIGLLALSATAAIAEAATRNGEIRYRGAFFGRLVTSVLGAGAGAVPVLLGIVGVVLPTLSAFVGLALLLELAVPLPAPAWAVLLGALAIAIPLRGRRTASFGGLMAFGLVSVALLAALSALALGEAALEGELAAPSLGPPGDIGLDLALGVIIGVLIGSYADPVYTVQIGRIVLPRDPDGDGYVRGSIAGMAAFVLLTVAFSAAVLVSVPASELAAEDGSALNTLSGRFGAAVAALGVLVGIGLFGIRLYGNAIALFDFVGERLPGRPARRLVLRAGTGRVLLTRPDARDEPLALAYRGLDGDRPVLAVTRTEPGLPPSATEYHLPPSGRREAISANGEELGLMALDADPKVLHLAVDTTMAISYDAEPDRGPGVAESLLADDEHAALAAWLIREGEATAATTAERFGWSTAEARRRLGETASAGRAEALGDDRFGPRMGARRRRRLDPELWTRLGAPDAEREAAVPKQEGEFARLLGSDLSRVILGCAPIAVVAALSAVLLAAGTASVSGPIRIQGIIALATISCVLPPLLLLASRRRSDAAGARGGRLLAGPELMAITGFTGFAVLVLHATLLWSDPIEQALAAIAALFAIAVAVLAIRHGAFRQATLLELRQDGEREPVRIRCEESGHPAEAQIQLGGNELGGAAELDLEREWAPLTVRGRSEAATEVRVSAQSIDRSGSATALPLSAALEESGDRGPIRLDEVGGIAAFETGRAGWTLVLTPDAAGAPDDQQPQPAEQADTPRRRRARPGSPLDKL